MSSAAAGHLTEHLTGDGCDVVHVLTIDLWDPLTADEVLVALTEVDDRTFGPWVRINSHVLSFLVELRGTCDDDYVWKAKYATVFPLFLIDQHPTPVSLFGHFLPLLIHPEIDAQGLLEPGLDPSERIRTTDRKPGTHQGAGSSAAVITVDHDDDYRVAERAPMR